MLVSVGMYEWLKHKNKLGEIGNKKIYDPRTYGRAAETSMAARVTQLCRDLRSAGRSLAQ